MNKTKFTSLIASLVLAITFTLSCEDKEGKNKFTDSRDDKKYKTVTIGNQTWMAENLNYQGEDVAGPKLKAKSGWDTGGYYGFWWGATNGNNVYGHKVSYHDNTVSLYYYNKSDLFSVRCVQD